MEGKGCFNLGAGRATHISPARLPAWPAAPCHELCTGSACHQASTSREPPPFGSTAAAAWTETQPFETTQSRAMSACIG